VNWPHDELLHELLIVPRRAYLPWSGTEVIERPGWLQLVTASFRQGGLNEVIYAQLDASEADAVIDATIARYRELGLRFRWTVTPHCRPHDLPERLERRGLERVDLLGMVRATDELPEFEASDVHVEVVDAKNLTDYIEIIAAGWGFDPASIELHTRALLADPVHRYALFLARVGDRPVAAAGCIAFDRSLYFQGGVVLPEFRQRGIYRALTFARLHYAAARGLGLATVHALRSSSAPLLEHFGFRPIVEFMSFRADYGRSASKSAIP
jgi:GNAT superfamily N-acetyltransferase